MLTHNDFVIKYLSENVDRDGAAWYQCTDFAKHYSKEVRGIIPGSFGWYAKNATQETFPGTLMISNPTPDQAKKWDILIQDSTPWNIYGHTGIIHRSGRFGYYLVEQNGSTGNGWWLGNDAIRVNYYKRPQIKVLKVFRKK